MCGAPTARLRALGGLTPQALAEDGCLLLGERLRSQQERSDVVRVVETVMKVKVGLDFGVKGLGFRV